MEEVQCKTCGNKVEENKLSSHLCVMATSSTPKGPMDTGWDICAEVRLFLQDYDERKNPRSNK